MTRDYDPFERMLALCNRLDRDRIPKTILHTAADTLTVAFATFGCRVEVYFNPDYAGYSLFRGDESVEGDFEALERMIADFADD